ncbi:MAG: hypothetical protein JNL90_06665 [Planctomycetes bacterium]|nr:hypothetical protein [Planctomycetota bacterium]
MRTLRVVALMSGALLAVAAWWLVSPPPPRLTPPVTGAPSSPRALADSSAPPAEAAPSSDSPIGSREAAPPSSRDAAASSAEPAAPAPKVGSGRVALRFVDAVDGALLSDLPFVLYSERPHLHLFARGVSDAGGEARFAELPEDVLIVATARRPPNAATTHALWLGAGESASVTVAVSRGVHATGRVVDDRGVPIAGASIATDSRAGPTLLHASAPLQPASAEVEARFAGAEPIAATSDGEGRFVLAAMAPQPEAIWIVDGAMRPERLQALSVHARFEGRPPASMKVPREALERVAVGGAASIELPDLVLPRPVSLAGVVVDEAGEPQPWVLVSTHRGRRHLDQARPFGARGVARFPAALVESASLLHDPPELLAALPREPEFVLLAGEALTDGAGRFAIDDGHSSGSALHVTLATIDGQVAELQLEALAPAAPASELRLVLPTVAELWLEVAAAAGSSDRAGWRSGRLIAPPEVQLLMRDGRRQAARTLATSAAGEFAVSAPVDRREVIGLSVESRGCLPFERRFAQPPARRERIVVELALRPALRLRLLVPPAAQSLESVQVELRACRVSAAAREAAIERDPLCPDCCGLGAAEAVAFAGTDRFDWELPVPWDAPYWLTVAGSEHGPFHPGEQRHEVTFDWPPPPPSSPRRGRPERARYEMASLTRNGGAGRADAEGPAPVACEVRIELTRVAPERRSRVLVAFEPLEVDAVTAEQRLRVVSPTAEPGSDGTSRRGRVLLEAGRYRVRVGSHLLECAPLDVDVEAPWVIELVAR